MLSSIARVTQTQMNAPMTSVSFTFFGEVCKKMEIKIVIIDLQCQQGQAGQLNYNGNGLEAWTHTTGGQTYHLSLGKETFFEKRDL